MGFFEKIPSPPLSGAGSGLFMPPSPHLRLLSAGAFGATGPHGRAYGAFYSSLPPRACRLTPPSRFSPARRARGLNCPRLPPFCPPPPPLASCPRFPGASCPTGAGSVPAAPRLLCPPCAGVCDALLAPRPPACLPEPSRSRRFPPPPPSAAFALPAPARLPPPLPRRLPGVLRRSPAPLLALAPSGSGPRPRALRPWLGCLFPRVARRPAGGRTLCPALLAAPLASACHAAAPPPCRFSLPWAFVPLRPSGPLAFAVLSPCLPAFPPPPVPSPLRRLAAVVGSASFPVRCARFAPPVPLLRCPAPDSALPRRRPPPPHRRPPPAPRGTPPPPPPVAPFRPCLLSLFSAAHLPFPPPLLRGSVWPAPTPSGACPSPHLPMRCGFLLWWSTLPCPSGHSRRACPRGLACHCPRLVRRGRSRPRWRPLLMSPPCPARSSAFRPPALCPRDPGFRFPSFSLAACLRRSRSPHTPPDARVRSLAPLFLDRCGAPCPSACDLLCPAGPRLARPAPVSAPGWRFSLPHPPPRPRPCGRPPAVVPSTPSPPAPRSAAPSPLARAAPCPRTGRPPRAAPRLIPVPAFRSWCAPRPTPPGPPRPGVCGPGVLSPGPFRAAVSPRWRAVRPPTAGCPALCWLCPARRSALLLARALPLSRCAFPGVLCPSRAFPSVPLPPLLSSPGSPSRLWPLVSPLRPFIGFSLLCLPFLPRQLPCPRPPSPPSLGAPFPLPSFPCSTALPRLAIGCPGWLPPFSFFIPFLSRAPAVLLTALPLVSLAAPPPPPPALFPSLRGGTTLLAASASRPRRSHLLLGG